MLFRRFFRLLLGVSVLISGSFAASAEVGVVALVNPDAAITRQTLAVMPEPGLGIEMADHFATDARGQLHLMFADRSTFTIGPRSEIVLDRFIYDPERELGELAFSATRGALRFVGGAISKSSPVEVRTQLGTIGIRGGILLMSITPEGGLTAVFTFGTSMTLTDPVGGQLTVTRPGFLISVSPEGVVSPPEPASDAVISALIQGLEARATAPGDDGEDAEFESDDPGEAAENPGGLPQDTLQQIADEVGGEVVGGVLEIETPSSATGADLVDLQGVISAIVEEQITETVEDTVNSQEEEE